MNFLLLPLKVLCIAVLMAIAFIVGFTIVLGQIAHSVWHDE